MSESDARRPAAIQTVVNLPPAAEDLKVRSEALVGRLLQRLQTTLQVDEVIHIFTSEIQSAVPFDYHIYQHGQLVLAPANPARARHELDYTLTLHGTELGSLKLRRRMRFSNAEIEAVENLLTALVYPLRNALMFHETQQAALTDALTGAANRRALDFELRRDISMARRYQHTLAFLVLDVDHFKRINDERGHAGGDAVLKALVEVVEACCRSSDTIFRMGGEEFGITIARASLEDCQRIAERIRSSIEVQRFAYRGVEIPVTVSIGCAICRTDDTEASLIERADQALYAAKRSGRNRIVLAEDLPRNFGITDAIQA